MNRRGFLLGAVQAAAALAVGDALLPKRTIFLPPRGGWLTFAHTKVGDTIMYGHESYFGLAPIKAEGTNMAFDELSAQECERAMEWIENKFIESATVRRQLRDSRLLTSRPTGFLRGRAPA